MRAGKSDRIVPLVLVFGGGGGGDFFSFFSSSSSFCCCVFCFCSVEIEG